MRLSCWLAGTLVLVVMLVCGTTNAGPTTMGSGGTIHVVDLRRARFPKVLAETLMTFQGVVNRDKPRLFILNTDDDLFWLNALESHEGIRHVIYTEPWKAFEDPELRALCGGLIVYSDADCELESNVAITMAGLKDCAIFGGTEDELAELKHRGFVVKEDLRGRWKTNEEAQAWAFKNLRPQCSSKYFAICRGGFKRNAPTDFMVEQKMFVLCINSVRAGAKRAYVNDAATTQRECLASYKPCIAYGEWSKEVPDIEFLSEFGHTQAGANANDSVYSHLPKPAVLKQKPGGELPKYDAGKTYIFVSFSQGDSLQFCQKFNLHHLTDKSLTDSSKRVCERYPFGLMQSTLQYQIQPIVPAVLYDQSAGAGQWFSGKGYGYANPSTLEKYGHLDEYLANAKQAMGEMGILDYVLNDRGVENDPGRKVLNKIARVLKPRSIIMKQQLDTKDEFDEPMLMMDGVLVMPDPVFDMDDADSAKEFDADLTVKRIVESEKKRQFFWVFLRHTVTADDLEKLMDKLAAEHKEIVILNPDVFIRFGLELAKEPALAGKIFGGR